MTASFLEDGFLAGVLLATLRILPTTLLSPLLGGPLVPPQVRLGLAAAVGWAGHSLAGAPPFAAPSLPSLLAAGARESLLGLALALSATLPIEAARAGGRLVDTLRGATLAELHVAPVRQRESATGDLLAQWCVVLAAWTGGDRLLVQGLLATFTRIAPGAALDGRLLGAGGLRMAAELLGCAVALAAPAAAGIFAADLALALVERCTPGVGATPAAQPARAALGLTVLAVAAAAVGGRLASLVAFAAGAPAWLAPGSSP